MTPWQEEEYRQERFARRPKCIYCEDPISTEHCLDLTGLGLPGYLCGRCAERSTLLTLDAQEA